MMHEFKLLINQAFENQKKGFKNVLASVVVLDGNSYRKPGVRMLICENGEITGAVSGGCVEKDIQKRAQTVFEKNAPIIMAYDGRYRLGCQGTIYVLLEPFSVSEDVLHAFVKNENQRKNLELVSSYLKEDDATGEFETRMYINQIEYGFNDFQYNIKSNFLQFKQKIEACFKLLIIGAEHDAVKLCILANQIGWEVEVISSWRDPKTLLDFPGAKRVMAITPEIFDIELIDSETAVVLMTHSYALDLQYLIKLKDKKCRYLGVLGSQNRNNLLRNELFEYAPDNANNNFFGPIGLDIGAQTPEEIAISILAEILMVIRNKQKTNF